MHCTSTKLLSMQQCHSSTTFSFFIPPYGSMGGYSVYCLFVCTVTDFSAAEKGRGVKFCMRVRLLSGQKTHTFYGPFSTPTEVSQCQNKSSSGIYAARELWLVGSHGGGITSGICAGRFNSSRGPGKARPPT